MRLVREAKRYIAESKSFTGVEKEKKKKGKAATIVES
jgi:hypothetical protein